MLVGGGGMSHIKLRIDDVGGAGHLVSVAIDQGRIELVGLAAAEDQAIELARREQPDVLLVDFDRLRPDSDLVPRVREVAPRTKVVVVSGGVEEQLVPLALEKGADGFVHRTVTPERLVRELSSLVSGVIAEAATAVTAEPASARRVRGFVGGALHGWGRADMDDVVSLLVSELVTNAIRHADSEVEVAVRLLPEALRVEVGDTGQGTPTVVEAAPDAEQGRGLAMVEALAAAWGVEPENDGKIVWFEIRP